MDHILFQVIPVLPYSLWKAVLDISSTSILFIFLLRPLWSSYITSCPLFHPTQHPIYQSDLLPPSSVPVFINSITIISLHMLSLLLLESTLILPSEFSQLSQFQLCTQQPYYCCIFQPWVYIFKESVTISTGGNQNQFAHKMHGEHLCLSSYCKIQHWDVIAGWVRKCILILFVYID